MSLGHDVKLHHNVSWAWCETAPQLCLGHDVKPHHNCVLGTMWNGTTMCLGHDVKLHTYSLRVVYTRHDLKMHHNVYWARCKTSPCVLGTTQNWKSLERLDVKPCTRMCPGLVVVVVYLMTNQRHMGYVKLHHVRVLGTLCGSALRHERSISVMI